MTDILDSLKVFILIQSNGVTYSNVMHSFSLVIEQCYILLLYAQFPVNYNIGALLGGILTKLTTNSCKTKLSTIKC